MDPRLRPYADQTAPRYTSYPTAPHFSPEIDARAYANWLGALSPQTRLSLYLHVPFCRDICWYCGCHTIATRKDPPVLDYAAALAAEIGLTAAATSARDVHSIHWGGGTPNILTPSAFGDLVAALNRAFDLSHVDEHSIEIDPRSLTPAHVEAFAAAGVTRASLGVQDLNDHVQRAIGRVQPFEVVARAVALLRAGGIARINLDLMYGLPNQTIEDARRTAELAADLAPDRLAAFGYAHVPWFKTRQRLIEEPDLPGADVRFDQADAMRAALARCGYAAIGFDHFARSGDALATAAQTGALTRSFQGYEADAADALLAFGASAISTLPQGYAQNATDVKAWARAIREGRFATARGCAVSDEDRIRRRIIEALLCAFEVDLAELGGFAAYPGAADALAPLAGDGLVAIDGERVRVTARGRPFARLAAQAFDAYRPMGQARHSRAV